MRGLKKYRTRIALAKLLAERNDDEMIVPNITPIICDNKEKSKECFTDN